MVPSAYCSAARACVRPRRQERGGAQVVPIAGGTIFSSGNLVLRRSDNLRKDRSIYPSGVWIQRRDRGGVRVIAPRETYVHTLGGYLSLDHLYLLAAAPNKERGLLLPIYRHGGHQACKSIRSSMSARRGERTRPRFTPWLLPPADSVSLLLLGYCGNRIPVGFDVYVELRTRFVTETLILLKQWHRL